MAYSSQNIRKAAVLIRSLDAETAARLLAQLPPAEAKAVREAVATLGPIDSEEQADVAAELRRSLPLAGAAAASRGVELELTSVANATEFATYSGENGSNENPLTPWTGGKSSPDVDGAAGRFEFLEQAPIATLVPYLSREHVQTIAVVLSYLSPARAAEILGALPSRQQADTLERLSVLGETDADSVKVVEQELAAWVSGQSSHRRGTRSGGAANVILAAANTKTRAEILENLKDHKSRLAAQLGGGQSVTSSTAKIENTLPANPSQKTQSASYPPQLGTQLDALRMSRATAIKEHSLNLPRRRDVPPPARPSAPRFQYDDLIQLDGAMLSAILHDVDPKLLLLALAGSTEALVERITGQMPRRTAKVVYKQLKRLGPTRLSDVEAAQQAIARAAASRTLGVASVG